MTQKLLLKSLKNALFISQITNKDCIVAITGIGTFHIKKHHVELKTNNGEWKTITENNLKKRVNELSSFLWN